MQPARVQRVAAIIRWVVCLAATLAALWLHFAFKQNAGGLWRDETGGFNIAVLPTLSDTWERLTLDSSPLLSPLLLRTWASLGLDSDAGLRWYGLLIGLAVTGSLWASAWLMGRRLPVVSLGLLATSVTLVRWGDSVRAYGLGCIFLLLTLGAVWRLSLRRTLSRFIIAAVLAIASVQTLYHNAFFLLAIGLAAAFVAARRKDPKSAAAVLAVGFIAAISLLPYVPQLLASSNNWWVIQKTGFQPDWVWFNVKLAAGSPYNWQTGIWIAIAILSTGAGFWAGWRQRGSEADLRLFASLTILIGIFSFLLFIWISGLPTQAWYYLPVLVLIAACANAVLLPSTAELPQNRSLPEPVTASRNNPIIQFLPMITAAGLVFVSFGKADDLVRHRATNVDAIADTLESIAAPADFILIHPWYCGVTFHRYYGGDAAWSTVPPMPDLRLPRFDLLKEMMVSTNPMPPVVERCRQTLLDGHTLWLIGWFSFDGQPPPDLPRAPLGPGGWNEVPYEDGWAREVSFLVTSHARELKPFPLAVSRPVSPYENLEVFCAKGWRTNAHPGSAHPK